MRAIILGSSGVLSDVYMLVKRVFPNLFIYEMRICHGCKVNLCDISSFSMSDVYFSLLRRTFPTAVHDGIH